MPAVNPPEGLGWLWDLLILGTSFQHWPNGDPDKWRELGQAWEDLGNELIDAYTQMSDHAAAVPDGWGGDAGGAFINGWMQFVNDSAAGPSPYIDVAFQYYEGCLSGAMELEFAQLMCLIILAITALEILIAALIPGGEVAEPGIIAASRPILLVVLKRLAQQLSKQFVKTAVKDAAKLAAKDAAKPALEGAGQQGPKDARPQLAR